MEKEIVKNELELFVEEKGIKDLFPGYPVFNEFIEQAKEWREKGMSLKVTSLEQVEEMAQAREGRLILKNLRTSIEKKRKFLKEKPYKEGVAIDQIAKFITSLIEPTEEHLDEQEKFVEKLQEKIRQEKKAEREEKLKIYGVETGFFDLASMPEETFTNLLENSKLAYESRLANEKKVEEERIRLEKINGRIKQLIELGYKNNGLGLYIHEYELQVSRPVVEDCKDEIWDALIIEMQNAISEIKAGKDKELEELRLSKAESDKKIKEAEDAANKLKEEQAKKESDLLARNNLGKSRQKLLADIGVPVEFDLAADIVTEDWNKFFNKHIDDYNARKKAEQEAADLLAKQNQSKVEDFKRRLLADGYEKNGNIFSKGIKNSGLTPFVVNEDRLESFTELEFMDRLNEVNLILSNKQKEIDAENELSKCDKEKFETLINDLEALKTKYTFKSKKHQKLSLEVNELFNRVILHIQGKK